jgi:hypothetical protein
MSGKQQAADGKAHIARLCDDAGSPWVMLRREYVIATGDDHKSAIMLARLIHLSDQGTSGKPCPDGTPRGAAGWIYVTRQQWQQDCRLDRREYERAVQRLVSLNLIEIDRDRDNTIWYRVRWTALEVAVRAAITTSVQNVPTPSAQSVPRVGAKCTQGRAKVCRGSAHFVPTSDNPMRSTSGSTRESEQTHSAPQVVLPLVQDEVCRPPGGVRPIICRCGVDLTALTPDQRCDHEAQCVVINDDLLIQDDNRDYTPEELVRVQQQLAAVCADAPPCPWCGLEGCDCNIECGLCGYIFAHCACYVCPYCNSINVAEVERDLCPHLIACWEGGEQTSDAPTLADNAKSVLESWRLRATRRAA